MSTWSSILTGTEKADYSTSDAGQPHLRFAVPKLSKSTDHRNGLLGAEWNYAKEQCERNAQIEGVADRISFQKGDAAKLDFPDETFDAAVSNFVFHEVRTAKDKRDVVREALRVVKKGGVFSFQDMFSQKALYGDMEQFVRELKAEGISEVHYIGNLEKKLDFIPGFVTTPWMISGMGIIYGKK
mgnify:CR=1 FL=1